MRSNVILDPQTQEIYEEIPAPLIEYLIFEGGGIRGLAYSGLVEILESIGMLEKINHVGGSSIGSIAALLVSLGCLPDEIKDILEKLPYKSFLEGKDPSFLQFFIAVFIKRIFSLSSGNKLKEWVEDLLEKKLGNRHATFADLAKKVAENADHGKPFKYLSVVGSNISKNRLETFNHETTPNMPIAIAILISASYPGVFKPVEWNGDLYLDGGLMNNLPSFLFNDRKYLPAGYDLNDKGANPSVLHVKIDTTDEMCLLWNNYRKRVLTTIYEYCIAVLYGMQSRDGELTDQIPTNIVQIFDCDIGTFDVAMDDLKKILLLHSGIEGMLEWLYNHYNEAYTIKRYKNEAEWLASKSVNEIAEIKQYYISVLKNELQQNVKNDDYIAELENKIDSLTQYITSYSHNLNFPNQKIPLLVTPHINIHGLHPREQIDKKIKSLAESRLQLLEEKINFLQSLLHETKSRIYSTTDSLHNGPDYDQVVYTSILEEELKFFKAVRRSLQRILNLPQEALPQRSNYQAFQESIYKFLEKKTAAWSAHFGLLQYIQNDLEEMIVTVKDKNEIITLDLRHHEDFKMYIMACRLYLKFIDCNSAEICKRIDELYQELFHTSDIPKNIVDLGKTFDKNAVDSLILAYRIEGLIKNFAYIDRPKERMKFQLINIDDIFGRFANPKWELPAIFAKKQESKIKTENQNEIEMTSLYKPFAHTEKFLMFHNVALQNPATPISQPKKIPELCQTLHRFI